MLIISKYYRFSIKISIKIKLNKCMYNTTKTWQPYGRQVFVDYYTLPFGLNKAFYSPFNCLYVVFGNLAAVVSSRRRTGVL